MLAYNTVFVLDESKDFSDSCKVCVITGALHTPPQLNCPVDTFGVHGVMLDFLGHMKLAYGKGYAGPIYHEF